MALLHKYDQQGMQKGGKADRGVNPAAKRTNSCYNNNNMSNNDNNLLKPLLDRGFKQFLSLKPTSLEFAVILVTQTSKKMGHMEEGGNNRITIQNAVFIWFRATDKSSCQT